AARPEQTAPSPRRAPLPYRAHPCGTPPPHLAPRQIRAACIMRDNHSAPAMFTAPCRQTPLPGHSRR
ncbi:hypothetical protein FVW20_12275, partial [Desulfovibrio oxamicus]|nr:hypothetical protein [Nitratidesulfovibrio oxamicus]